MRVYTTLPELTEQYLELARQHQRLTQDFRKVGVELRSLRKTSDRPDELRAARERRRQLRKTLRDIAEPRLALKREEMHEHLKALGNPPTKMYPGQLPLFPLIYRIWVAFDNRWSLDLIAWDRKRTDDHEDEMVAKLIPPVVWDSEVPRHSSQFQSLPPEPIAEGAFVHVQYHLHAYSQRQFKERQETTRRLWLSGLGMFFALLASCGSTSASAANANASGSARWPSSKSARPNAAAARRAAPPGSRTHARRKPSGRTWS